MVKPIRIILLLITVAAAVCWWQWRRPASLSDQLARVYYPAFQIEGLSDTSGAVLANQVAHWPGVTAAAYNPTSRLLSLSCVEYTDESLLMKQLHQISGASVTKKTFEASRAQCPVPAELILKLPFYALYTAIGSALLLIASLFPFISKKQTLST